MKALHWFSLAAVCTAIPSASVAGPHESAYDLVIYGGASAGVIAAVQTKKKGKAESEAKRVLAAPAIPDSFDDRSWDEGELQTDLGPAKFQDIVAERNEMTLSLRRFIPPPKTWEVKTTKKMLDDAREHMLKGDKDLKLESEKDFKIDGFPGRVFIFTRKGSETVTRMDYFLLKPDLFIFYYSGPRSGLETEEVAEFFKGIKTMEAKPDGKGKGKRDGADGCGSDREANRP